MQIDGSWICGFMVGFEFVREEGEGTSHLVIDLFILRILFTIWDE